MARILNQGLRVLNRFRSILRKNRKERNLGVYMDLNDKCMLRCITCLRSRAERQFSDITMPLDLFENIAAQVFPKASFVNLSCAAEPLLVRNFADYLKISSKYDVPHRQITTNALLLHADIIDAIISTGLSEVQISIDAATKETHERIRKGSSFPKLIANIELLQQEKQNRNKKLPRVNFCFTLMRSNMRELPDFLRLAKTLQVERVRATHLIPFAGLDIMNESLVHCQEEANEILRCCRKLAEEIGIDCQVPPDFPADFDNNRPLVFTKPHCRAPFTTLYITHEGKVVPCDAFPPAELCAGSFLTQSFNEIWHGPVYTSLRKQFSDKTFTPYCLNCPSWGIEPFDNYVFIERSPD